MHTVRAQRVSTAPLAGHASPVSIAIFDLSIGLIGARDAAFALYQRIRVSHRYISGPHFHEYRALLEAHAEELLAASHALDARIRHLRGSRASFIELGINMHSSNDDDDVEYVTPEDLLFQFRLENQDLARTLRSTQVLCQSSGDIVTESLIDVWIDEARRRAAVLTEATWGD
jgi:starvation-inducible DNA-binding protein